ncbi:MAG: hypothetical protein WAV45_08755 [Propionibacteriaceae bacterium]|nr:hypothetical protein [Micropruina sp.]
MPARYPGQTASYPGQYPPQYPMQPQGPFQYPSANPYQPLGPQSPYGSYPASSPTTWRRIVGLVLVVVGSTSAFGILQAVLRLMSDGGGFAFERLIGSILFSALFMVPGLVLMNSKK